MAGDDPDARDPLAIPEVLRESTSRPRTPPPADSAPALQHMRLASLGFELVAYIAAGGLIGRGLDKWLATGNALTVTGLILGIVGGGYRFIRVALQVSRDLDNPKRK